MATPRKFNKNAAAPVNAPATAPTPSPAPAGVTRSEIKGSGTAKAKLAAPSVITHDLISKRAYEIYASRGYAAGNPDDDWREAERQLRAGL